ncbi:laminin subunit alpha-4 [Gastrophryne carolinensis]
MACIALHNFVLTERMWEEPTAAEAPEIAALTSLQKECNEPCSWARGKALLGHLCSSIAAFEGSAFHLEAEGSTSSSGKFDSNIIDVQQSYIPARLIPPAQRCQPGFYYSVSGECLPCSCNGNSHRCLDGSGSCTDCQRNTTGNHCEKCPTGYMADVVDGVLRSCVQCSCPLPFSSNNFALTCAIKRGSVRCICKESFAGPKCERCAPGYYGSPLLRGGTCKKCDCNGNSDPNLIFEDCNEITGQCNGCMHNTTGFKCEHCAPWYYGDARVAKNCTQCHCSKCGAETCNDRTGKCHCKPGVTGPACDRCQIGYYGFDSCLGCQKCECDVASIDNNCDPISQQCRCRPGTGGLKCERCQSGYWNYGPYGCQKCNCGGGPCNNKTGECLLEDPDYPSGSGCSFNCDKCIWELIDDLRLSDLLINETRSTIRSISTGVAVNKLLSGINSSVIQLTGKLQTKKNSSIFEDLQIDNVETEVELIQGEVNGLAQKGNLAEMKGQLIHKETTAMMSRAKLTAEQVSDIEDEVKEILLKLKHFETLQGEVSPSDRIKSTKEAERMLKDLSVINFNIQRKLVQDEADDAEELLIEVQEDWVQLQNNTLSLFPIVLEPIDEYSNKLSNLQEVLNETLGSLMQTTYKNTQNNGNLLMHHAQVKNMNETATSTSNALEEAWKTLNESHMFIMDINDTIKNASAYHAEIDGANNELKIKLANLSRNVEDLVQQAVNHALVLQRHADGLKSDLKDVDTNGLVQKALDAFNVYEKIATLVEDANETSVVAMNAADRAKDAVDGIENQVAYQKGQGERLTAQARDLGSVDIISADNLYAPLRWYLRYLENRKCLAESRQRVDAALDRKIFLNDRLANINTQLQLTENDETRKRLKQSALIADKALNISATVSEVADPMSKNAKVWAENLSNADFYASSYNSVVKTAGETVKNLTEVIPLLLNKVQNVEHKLPSTNISSSIHRIRELIAQTRSIASKVQVSMKFSGNAAVSVNLKANPADLKAYSSISLYINPHAHQQQPKDRFIMYLGHKNAKSDYLGLAIKRNNLVFVYNLGSGDVEIPLDSKPINTWPGYFSLVKIERLGRHGKVLLTIPSQSGATEEKFIKKGEAPGSDSLLDLELHNTVFYTGGVPEGFKLPDSLNLPGFVGCLELASVNDDVVSLYNFKKKYNINTVTAPPCERNKLAFTQSRAASYFFDGSGYAVIRNIERRGRFTQVTRFDIEVRTPVDNALVFLMVNGSKFFSMEIQDGYLRILYDFGFSKGPVLLDDSMKKAQINDAKYHEISVIYHNSKKMILVVDRKHVKSVDNDKTSIPFTDIYIGGAPSHILESMKAHLAADITYRGCMKSFQFQKKDFNLLEEPDTIGISHGCPEDSLMSRKAYFNGQSFIATSQKITPFEAYEGGFSFKTLQPSGLLLYHSEGADLFSISMDKGAVVLTVKDIKVQSKSRKYNDGHNHFIVASVSPTRCNLIVDETDNSSQQRDKKDATASTTENKFYFGGSPNSASPANFTGCISNAYFTRPGRDVEVEDFQKYAEKVQTSLYGCPVETPPIALTHKHRKNSSKAKGKQKKRLGKHKAEPSYSVAEPKGIETEEAFQEASKCTLSGNPRSVRNAYRYGGTANSRHEFKHLPKLFNQKSEFSFRLRTDSSNGMILYISDEEEVDFVTLFLADGRLNFMFNVGDEKLTIKTQKKYNDGMWHNVICIREMNRGKLVIDGLRVLQASLPATGPAWRVEEPLYVGGVAPERAMKNVEINSVYSFHGCLGDLMINERSVTSPSHTFSVTPCFDGLSESGTYIASEGGYVILAESFQSELKTEFVIEVRPRSNSGILLHVQNVKGEYLNMHMKEGQVVVKVKFDNKEFSTSVVPKQSLCDGQWHRIAVIREGIVLQLDVDSEINHVIAPLDKKLVNLKEPVFVGGVPDSLLAPSLTTRNSFTGCIRNFVIDNRPVSFNKASLVSGAVSVNSCPSLWYLRYSENWYLMEKGLKTPCSSDAREVRWVLTCCERKPSSSESSKTVRWLESGVPGHGHGAEIIKTFLVLQGLVFLALFSSSFHVSLTFYMQSLKYMRFSSFPIRIIQLQISPQTMPFIATILLIKVNLTCGTVGQFEDFVDHLNSNEFNIFLTAQSPAKQVTFLDLTVSIKEDGSICTDLYRKETSVNSLLHYSSFHPTNLKQEIPIGQFLRIRRNCSDEEDFLRQANDLTSRFIRRGYPKAVVQRAFLRAKDTPRSNLLVPKKRKRDGPQVRYITRFNNQWHSLRRILHSNWHILKTDPLLARWVRGGPRMTAQRAPNIRDRVCSSHFAPVSNWLRDQNSLVGSHPCGGCSICPLMTKDKTVRNLKNGKIFHIRQFVNCKTVGVVYVLKCSCPKLYVGETKNSLKARIQGHISNIRLAERNVRLAIIV